MRDFVVQYRFDAGAGLSELETRWEELAGTSGESASCVMMAGALDGRRAVGFCRASDEHALRSRLDAHGIPYRAVWAASPLQERCAEVSGGLSSVLIERETDVPVTKEMVLADFLREQSCYDLRGAVWRQSYLASDGRRLVCWFAAPDAEAVRSAIHSARHLPGTVWSAAWVKGAL